MFTFLQVHLAFDVFYDGVVLEFKSFQSVVCSPDEQSLEARALSHQSVRRSVGVQTEAKHTSIELIGRNRPGLLSEIFAVLTDLKCNVVAAEVWTHNSRLASVVYVTDEVTGAPIDDTDRLSKIRHLLRYVLKGNRDKQSARTAISMEPTHAGRRLHQMMLADQQYRKEDDMGQEEEDGTDGNSKPLVTVENCIEKEYTVVNIRCKDRPKLLFDTVCTLTDMQYVVFHATIITEGPEACQVYPRTFTSDYNYSQIWLVSSTHSIFVSHTINNH